MVAMDMILTVMDRQSPTPQPVWCHEHHSYRPHPTLTLSTQWASREYHSSRSHPRNIPQQHPQCIVIISNPEGDGHAKPPLGLTRVGPCEGVTWASLLKLTPAPVEHPAPAPTMHLTTGTPQTRTYNALQWLQLPVRKFWKCKAPPLGSTWVPHGCHSSRSHPQRGNSPQHGCSHGRQML